MAVLRNQNKVDVRSRASVLAHPEYELTRGEMQRFKNFVARRARREPLAYIVGHKEFYGFDFVVNRQVMVPRPETEELVEQAMALLKKHGNMETWKHCIVDVGTGSGAIVVALAKQYGVAHVSSRKQGRRLMSATPFFIATDISRKALKVARANAQCHGVAKHITFLRGNLLKPLFNHLTTLPLNHLTVVANLPYLPTAEWRATAPEIKNWEPRGALDGGRDGLKYYREMFRQLSVWVSLALSQPVSSKGVGDVTVKRHRYGQRNRHPITVLCELCPHQMPAFKKLVLRYFPRAIVEADRHIAVVRIND